jgi:hypothetical protein
MISSDVAPARTAQATAAPSRAAGRWSSSTQATLPCSRPAPGAKPDRLPERIVAQMVSDERAQLDADEATATSRGVVGRVGGRHPTDGSAAVRQPTK